MKIAVISLPLHTNYGGILQSYALKKVLEDMGHEATVIDRKVKMPFPKWWKAPFVYLNRALKHVGRNSAAAPEVFREFRFRKEYPVLSARLQEFIDKNISPVTTDSYKDIRKSGYEAFVVGSDQVWRPRYFGRIEDAFLDFARDLDVKRVAYAASFGTDRLEFEAEQLRICAGLLQDFDGVSVREDSAVAMCDEWLDFSNAAVDLHSGYISVAGGLDVAGRLLGQKLRGTNFFFYFYLKVAAVYVNRRPSKICVLGH